MKTMQVMFPKIHCKKKNDWLNKDHVFVAMIISTFVKSGDGQIKPKILLAKCTSIVKIGKDEIYQLPTTENWLFSIPDESQLVNVSFCLYERDSGDVFDRLQQSFTRLEISNEPTVIEIIEKVLKESKITIGDIMAGMVPNLINMLSQFSSLVYKKIRMDDLLAMKEFSVKKSDTGIAFIREFDMNGKGAEYKLQVVLTELAN